MKISTVAQPLLDRMPAFPLKKETGAVATKDKSSSSLGKTNQPVAASKVRENLFSVLYSGLDAFMRLPFRQIEGIYNIAESALWGPVYRTLTEFVRHGVTTFARDAGNCKNDYKKRLSSSLPQMLTRTAENVFGFLAFKPNLVSTASGRAQAGFGNMFVRLLPRMIFVAYDWMSDKTLNFCYLFREFLARTVMRMFPRNGWGMLMEQLGINTFLIPPSFVFNNSVKTVH